jgi:hypothetical protein
MCEPAFFGQNKYNLSEFGNETVTFVKTPAHWDARDWLTLGVVGGGTFLVYQFDQRIRDRQQESFKLHPSYQKNIFMQIGEQWGGYFVVPLLPVLLYTTGSLANSNKTKKIGFEMAQAAIYSEVISFTSKTIIGRSRPFNGEGPGVFKPFSFLKSPYNSFPAGHTDAAMALSTVLAKNTDSYILKTLAYIPAVLTLAQRVYSDNHWSSDVVIGAALGYFVGNWVVNLHDQKESRVQVTSLYPLGLSVSLNKMGK